jgi:zinc D-Ala-D-Ala carboxypeptidase
MTKLSKHFSLAELTVTSTGIPNAPDTPAHLTALHVTAAGLETVRRLLGDAPIIITSGYRCRRVNKAVGGVDVSDHTLGYAADFRHSILTAKECCERIVESCLAFDQLILERRDTLVHLSFNPRLRREVLRQWGGPGSAFSRGLD